MNETAKYRTHHSFIEFWGKINLSPNAIRSMSSTRSSRKLIPQSTGKK